MKAYTICFSTLYHPNLPHYFVRVPASATVQIVYVTHANLPHGLRYCGGLIYRLQSHILSDEAMAQDFPRFRNLPAEIRCKVWKLLSYIPRTVALRVKYVADDGFIESLADCGFLT